MDVGSLPHRVARARPGKKTNLDQLACGSHIGRVKKSHEPETFNLYQAKTHLSELVERAAAGEEITIAKAGKPLARLVPLAQSKAKRRPGALKGKIWIASHFDDPVSPELLLGETATHSRRS